MRRLSFKTKTLALNTALIVGSMGALGAYFAHSNYERELVRAEQVVLSDSTTVFETMSTLFQVKSKLANSTVETLDHSNNDPKVVFDNSVVLSEFMVAGAYIADSGEFIENDPEVEVPDSYDARTRAWYKNAITKNGLVASDIYFDDVNKIQTITLSSQFGDDGSVAFFDINLDKISSALASTVGSSKTFDVMMSDGVVFLSSNPSHIGKTFNELVGVEFDLLSRSPVSVTLDDTKVMAAANTFSGLGKSIYVVTGTNIAKVENQAKESLGASLIAILIGCLVAFVANLVASNRLLRPIGQLNMAVEKIAHGEGDLTQQIDASRFEQEFWELASNINKFIESTRANMALCIENARAIGDITISLTNGSSQTIDLMKSQGEEVDSLVNSMDEMLIATKGIAQSAESAAVSANETDFAAEDGIRIVDESQRAMRDLSDIILEASSNVSTLSQTATKIENVTGAISGVAEQTNLLALNAAIEAARAGEQGRGFAVVADEVRELAMRTQQSTNEIAQIVQEIQASIESVVGSMEVSVDRSKEATQKTSEVEVALQTIKKAANTISQMNEQIATASEEQSCVAASLEQGTQSLKSVSDSVSGIVENTTESLSEQEGIISEQQLVLQRFKV